MERLVGKIVNSRYRIQSVVGVGGMAIVYKAIDMENGTTVAIKVLKHEFLEDESFRLRFENESRAISILKDKNIVKVYDVALNDDLYYIVMEFLDGITLKQYIRQQEKLTWRETLYFLSQILKALAHAHSKGIIHRDIKPQNMMLLSDGSIKVTDFGIARFATTNTNTMTDKAIGSVHYISPEQVSAERVDARSDLYSVGVMLYEMMTGTLPFDAENPVSVALMQLQNNPEEPTKRNAEIPQGLEEIILKCMSKNPDNRYKDVEELMQDIEMFKQNPSIKFEYKYIADDNPTKYIDIIKNVKEDEESNDENAKKKYLNVMAGIISAVVLFSFALMFFLLQDPVEPLADVEIPDLIGMSYEEILANEEFSTNFNIILSQEVYNSEYEKGEVFYQSPSDGMMVRPGADIRVNVSLGGEIVEVPDVSNQNYIIAENEMRRNGLEYKIFHENSDSIAVDNVIRCEPAAGTEVAEGSEVSIYVSLGREVKKVEVPFVVGTSETEARTALTAQTLVPSVTRVASDKPEGEVITQNIAGGDLVDEYTIIELTVSDGSEAPIKEQITINFPNDRGDIRVKVSLDGETVYSETHHSSEEFILLDLYGRGTQLVMIYMDDILWASNFIEFRE